MSIYIALLRGINVGGKNMIKMADLRKMFETMGFDRVKTYIQSGNVLFESDDKEEELRKQIEEEIIAVFGFSISVVLRSAAELEQIIKNCPFSKEVISEAEASSEGESLYVTLLSEVPSQQGIDQLSIYRNEREVYKIEGRDLYLLFRDSIRNSKLSNNLQKLEVTGTTRNWKTINKLVDLAGEMKNFR